MMPLVLNFLKKKMFFIEPKYWKLRLVCNGDAKENVFFNINFNLFWMVSERK